MYVLSVDVATTTEGLDGGDAVRHERSAYLHCFKYYAAPWAARCERKEASPEGQGADHVSLNRPLIIRPLLDVVIDLHGFVGPSCDVKITGDAISWGLEALHTAVATPAPPAIVIDIKKSVRALRVALHMSS